MGCASMNFGIARGMARLILDPYCILGTVAETTDSEIVRWILYKVLRGSSEEWRSFCGADVLGQKNLPGRIWNRTVHRGSRVAGAYDIPARRNHLDRHDRSRSGDSSIVPTYSHRFTCARGGGFEPPGAERTGLAIQRPTRLGDPRSPSSIGVCL